MPTKFIQPRHPASAEHPPSGQTGARNQMGRLPGAGAPTVVCLLKRYHFVGETPAALDLLDLPRTLDQAGD
jgi:hypothetical protein